ncbi:MAG: hypothetical protein KatS3mg015_0387 [Fimbriimonadales bacterium]|nr:MAG: hypothetical protein KatS3mg015_0387 [Fimbriimonadales bacterium]
MSPRQRLLAGVGFGIVAALFLHPTSRAFLLYGFHDQEPLQSLVENHPIAKAPTEAIRRPPPEGASLYDLSVLSYQIARRINVRGQAFVNPKDSRVASQFLARAAVAEPDNAFWPQMLAVLAHRSRSDQEAAAYWERAAVLGSWSDRRAAQIEDFALTLARADGMERGWQWILGNRVRTSDAATVILRSAAASFDPVEGDFRRLRQRAVALANAGLILQGAYSVEARLAACTLAYRAAEMGAGPRGTILDPRRFEGIRSSFVQAVSEEVGAEAGQEANRTLLRAEGWLRLIKPSAEIEAERDRIANATVLTAMLPSSLLKCALVFFLLAGVGWFLRWSLGGIPHPDPRALLVAAAVGAGAIYWATGLVSLGLWVVLLGVVLALPIEVGKPNVRPPQRWERSSLLGVGCGGFGLLAWYFVSASVPSRLLLHLYDPDSPPWLDESPNLLIVALVVLSLVVLVSRVIAGRRHQAPFAVLGYHLAWLGVWLGIAGIVVAALITPVTIKVEQGLIEVGKSWAQDEQRAFRID